MTTAAAWLGVTVDHLFADCPSRVRAEATLRAAGWWRECCDQVDPFGTDICGLCVLRYKTKTGAS